MKRKLLIVDDSIFICEEMVALLKDSEYEVVGYSNTAEDALEEIRRIQPDGVTMDIILPGMDGFEATRIIKSRNPEMKVLTISSLAYEETMKESEDSGADGFVFKPIEKKVLLNALDKVFHEPE